MKERPILFNGEIDGATWVMTDIRLRMLQPDELARAQGFAQGYQLPPVKYRAIRLIGNSVAPPVGQALVNANKATMAIAPAVAV